MYTNAGFLAFIQPVWGFSRTKFQRRTRYHISIEKVIFIFVIGHPILWKMVMLPKIIFHGFLFWKNCYTKNIQNIISLKIVYTDFCCQTPPSPQNGNVIPQVVFFNFFNINWRTSARFSCSKVYSFERKFYGE